MSATIHLGDCLNSCETCATNHHANFKGLICPDCSLFIEHEFPFCNACGLRHALGDCDLEVEEKLNA